MTMGERSISVFFQFWLVFLLLADPPGASAAQSAESLIRKGDICDRDSRPAKALEYYLHAQKLRPGDADLLTRIARQYRHLMSDGKEIKQKLRLGRISLAYATRASELAPTNSEAQLSPAISYGKMMPYFGKREQVKASPLIKAAADRALALDPQNDTAWHILGRWNRVLANVGSVKRALAGAIYGPLPETTNEMAEKCLKNAIAINPNRLMHYVELGRIYAQMGRVNEARKFLLKGLSMRIREHDDPENKAIARATLQSLN